MAGPLDGIRVLDFSSVVMGPYATQLMGDMGADVICVEDPKGDTNRAMGAGPDQYMSGVSLNLLRNKRNVCLDLKKEGARDAFLALASTCHVVVTNLRPGPLGRLRLTYADVCAVRPDVVFCQAHGWPSDSPYAELAAYDDIIQTAAGVADTFFLATGVARMAPTIFADKVSGLTILYSVLAALLHRERTGEGQFIEVPMVDAVSNFVLAEHGAAAIPVPPMGPAGYPRILTPNRRPHETSDGWVAILPYSNEHYRLLLIEGKREDLIEDPRLKTARSRIANASFFYETVGEIVRVQTTEYWMKFCRQHDIPASPVVTLDELVSALPIAEHDRFGTYRQIGHGARFSATPSSVRRHAPTMGQHDAEVLAEVGLSVDAVDALRESGALQARKA